MTATTAERVARVRRKPASSMAGALAAAILSASSAAARPVWPSERYRAEPVAFFREVLGVEPWRKQIEVIEAVRDHKRVSVRAGHKCSKSNTDAGIALWFYSSFEDARVVMSSVTDRQVNSILWRELRKMIARTGRCAACRARDPMGSGRCDECNGVRLIPEVPHELARSGLKAPDFREIVGFTAKEAEAVAGISGKNLLYILDEASGIPDEVYEAVEGNRAGGARVLLTGNPTRCEGWFYQSHNERASAWKTIHISSEDSPNVIEGRDVIPGLATREWVEEMREEWGEDSALYQVRVRGNFAKAEDQKVIPLYLVDEAEERWPDTVGEGGLQLGVDCARFGDDDSAIAPRRGQRVIELVTRHGLSERDLAAEVIQVVRRHRLPLEAKPLVKVDACGGIGLRVCAELYKYGDEIEVIPVNVAEKSTLPGEYPLLRDQLWFGLRIWLKEGGALPEDKKLAAELTAPKFSFDEKQRRKVESKDEIRKRLKRSPDRADAVSLSVWEPRAWRRVDDEPPPPPPPPALAINPYGGEIDPYGGSGEINPYGGGP